MLVALDPAVAAGPDGTVWTLVRKPLIGRLQHVDGLGEGAGEYGWPSGRRITWRGVSAIRLNIVRARRRSPTRRSETLSASFLETRSCESGMPQNWHTEHLEQVKRARRRRILPPRCPPTLLVRQAIISTHILLIDVGVLHRERIGTIAPV